MYSSIMLAAGLLAPPGQPAPDVKPVAPVPVIVMPTLPPHVPTEPPPAPTPPTPVTPSPDLGPVKLPPDVFYVMESATPFMVISSPPGMVNVVHETGPVKLLGRFIEDPSKIETRKYEKAHVAYVTAAKAGECELITWPIGADKEEQIIRRKLDTGMLPRPPPTPPDVKPVDPVKPPLPTVGDNRVLFLAESKNVPPRVAAVMNAAIVRDYLWEKCAKGIDGKQPDYRYYDKDADVSADSPTIQKMMAAARPDPTKFPAEYAAFVKSLPVVVIFKGGEGESFPLPQTGNVKADSEALLALLKKYFN